MSDEKTDRTVYKKVSLNYLEREIILDTMLRVFKNSASGTNVYWMNKVDIALELDKVVEWRMGKDELIAKRIAEYQKDNSKKPMLSDEENLGPNEEVKLIRPAFKFVQDFLANHSEYAIGLRKYVSDIHKKFAIKYEEKTEAVDAVEEDVTEEDVRLISK